MLLQTNSYIVPKDKRAEHARLLRRFRQTLLRLGCDHFEVYEQVGANWNTGETTGRFVQILRFRDRKHQISVQTAERNDTQAQQLVVEFCDLINFPYQQQQGLFAVGFYTSFLKMPPQRTVTARGAEEDEGMDMNAPVPSTPEPGVPSDVMWPRAAIVPEAGGAVPVDMDADIEEDADADEHSPDAHPLDAHPLDAQARDAQPTEAPGREDFSPRP